MRFSASPVDSNNTMPALMAFRAVRGKLGCLRAELLRTLSDVASKMRRRLLMSESLFLLGLFCKRKLRVSASKNASRIGSTFCRVI